VLCRSTWQAPRAPEGGAAEEEGLRRVLNQMERQHDSSGAPVGEIRATVAGGGPPRSGRRTRAVVGLAIVVAVTAVGLIVQSERKAAEAAAAPIPVSTVTARYSEAMDPLTGVVTVGPPTAAATIDLYEDFLCPACAVLYDAYDEQIRAAVERGELRVRFHLLPFLDQSSNPPGYSGRAANAAIAAAEGGKFVPYYSSLYEAQPAEGSAGYTDAQLLALGQALGLGPKFVDAVEHQLYVPAIRRDYQHALATVGKDHYQGSFRMPTIVHDGQLVTYEYQGRPIDWLGPLLDEAEAAATPAHHRPPQR
jgi:protein-disulfide isomerase